MQRRSALIFSIVVFLLSASAAAQVGPPNGILLIAKPGLSDPRFRETVVLATRAPDASTVGVILNRPTRRKLSELRPDAPAPRDRGPLFFGGPVMERSVIALFRSEESPPRAVFHVHRNIYMTMHPAVIEPLLAAPQPRLRLFTGFCGWAPHQLETELARNDWYVVPVTEEVLFRRDTSGMWEELLERARDTDARKRAALYWPA